MGKIGVLTSQRKWINDTVTIIAEGKIFIVGVVENTDDWYPFHPAPFDKVEEDSEDDTDSIRDVADVDDDEEDAFSDTWIGGNINDLEEGEICDDNVIECLLRC